MNTLIICLLPITVILLCLFMVWIANKISNKTALTKCYMVGSRPFMEKSIGVYYDKKEAIYAAEIANSKNITNSFSVYSAIITIIEKI